MVLLLIYRVAEDKSQCYCNYWRYKTFAVIYLIAQAIYLAGSGVLLVAAITH